MCRSEWEHDGPDFEPNPKNHGMGGRANSAKDKRLHNSAGMHMKRHGGGKKSGRGHPWKKGRGA